MVERYLLQRVPQENHRALQLMMLIMIMDYYDCYNIGIFYKLAGVYSSMDADVKRGSSFQVQPRSIFCGMKQKDIVLRKIF